MSKRSVAVLNFGTRHLSVLIGSRSVNGTFDIHGSAESEYGGYMNGEFLEPEKLTVAVQDTIAKAENNAFCKITHLYIGVPAEFSAVVVKDVNIDFPRRKRIKEEDVEKLFELADDFSASATHSVINRCPIYYVLDDGSKVIDPRGKITQTIDATLSFVLAEKEFLGTVNKILSPLHFETIDYFSEPLSETLFLLAPEVRDNVAILVDCGYLSTSVSLVMGDGLLCLRSFSLGGGHIMADLCSAFKISPKQAEQLKQDIAFNIELSPEDFYQVQSQNSESADLKFNAIEVNQVAKSRVVQIGKMIKKCLDDFDFEYPDYIPVMITGGGVCYMKGATNIISKIVDRDVQIIVPPVPQMDKPVSSASLSVLDLALKQRKSSPIMVLIKIFKRK